MLLDEIKNAETRIVESVNRFSKEKPGDMVTLYTGPMLDKVLAFIEENPMQRLEDIKQMFMAFTFSEEFSGHLAAEIVEMIYNQLLSIDIKKAEERLVKWRNHGANRALYVLEPVFEYYQLPDGTWRWKFKRELRSFGLMTMVVNELFGHQDQPVAIGILRKLEKKKRTPEERAEIEAIWKDAMRGMVENGIAVSGGRLGWNMKSPAWPILKRCFPKAIDMSAYCHGLAAPLIPEGFIPNVPITLRRIEVNGVDLETDGSGLYHPDAPQMRNLVAKYGLCAFQIRVVEPKTGFFAKGIVFPSKDAVDVDGNPTIVLDWKQVKGKWKKTETGEDGKVKVGANQRREENAVATIAGCFIGMLQAWNKPGKISACFEALQFINTNKETIETVESVVGRSMGLVEAKGIDGLVAAVAAKDPVIKMICMLVEAGRNLGLDIKAWQVPRVREALNDKLARRLYTITQGAGLRLPSFVARMDATVPQGKCIISGIKPGKKIAGFRFPLILSQGLLTLETIKPLPHHLVNGRMSPHTVILNPADAVATNADDDGDIFGLTDDESLVELFKHKMEDRTFAVEPVGVEIRNKAGGVLTTDSDEGLEYLMTDHRGPVGRCTIWQARLLAVGDLAGARAMSIAIQECIDKQKRKPEWSDIRLAVNLANWEQDANGIWHFTKRFKPEELEDNDFPMELINAWVDERIIAAGCCKKFKTRTGTRIEARDPLSWRADGKRIDLDNWSVPPENPETEKFENLVHKAERAAYTYWHKIAKQFITAPGTVSMELLLPTVFALKGINALPKALNERQYWELKNNVGLSAYNTGLARLQEAKRKEVNEEEAFKHHHRSMTHLQMQLEETLKRKMDLPPEHPEHISLSDIATIWHYECQPEGNVNNAFRVVCWDGSPIMETVLGIMEKPKCGFLTKRNTHRLEWLIGKAKKNADPFEGLREAAAAERNHAEGFKDKDGKVLAEGITDANGRKIQLHECGDCMDLAQTFLVNDLRAAKAGKESQYLKHLHHALKAEVD